jgi:hypothetical protein
MVQDECIRAVTADILAQPLFGTVEFGTGGTRPIGHHGRERAFDGQVNFTGGELLGDDVGDAQALPNGLEDLESAKGPGIEQAPRQVLFHDLMGGAFFADASSQLAQPLRGLGGLSPSAIGDHADFGALPVRIPHALRQLQMGHNGAIDSLLRGFTQVHVRADNVSYPVLSRKTFTCMYRGFGAMYRGWNSIKPDASVAPFTTYPPNCTCWCQSRVKAAALVAREDPASRFVIVGDGTLRPALEHHAQETRIADRVIFTGWRRDLPGIYADLDVLAVTSNNEGTPVSAIEAMAAGCPVVATNVGGLPDLIREGETGYLVPPGNAPAVATALLRVLHQPEMARCMGETARRAAQERFSAQRLITDMEHLYLELLGRKQVSC